jgi:hypothetical protein
VLLLSAVDGVADQLPELDVGAVANAVVLLPSYSFTVDDASALPVNVGVLSFVLVPLTGLDIIGAVGAVVSVVEIVLETDTVIALDVLILFAISYAFAVSVWEPFGTEAVFHRIE